jgi:hypothetical protein
VSWFDEYPGLFILGFIALLVGGFVYLIKRDREHKAAACARTLAAARTSADTVAVMLRCEVGGETRVQPVLVPIYTGR